MKTCRSDIQALLYIIPILLAISSCINQKKDPVSEKELKPKESLMEINRNLVKSEDQQIEDFVTRYKWPMNTTGTGLRYWIYEHQDKKHPKKGDWVELDYSVQLLTGEEIYTSATSGPKRFEIGKGGVETGLEEGILLLGEGDRAKFIIPSHLAFGLLGDQQKIPSKSALVYDVKILKIN